MSEAKGEPAAQLMEHLKKADMAREAERMLADTNWLPEILTLHSAEVEDAAAPEPAVELEEVDELPAFLVEGADDSGEHGSDGPDADDSPDFAVAAE